MRLPGSPSRAALMLLACLLLLPFATFRPSGASAQPAYPAYEYGADPGYFEQGAAPPYDAASPDYFAQGITPVYDDLVTPEYFEERLAPYGQWFTHPRWGDVWQVHAGPGFRPYYNGAWELTDEFGWLWVSGDPWGHITDHYGRWVSDPDAGWLWIPGYVWGPSWVIWREGGGYIGWFPMPPGYDEFDPHFDVYAGGNVRDPADWYGYRTWYPQMADTSFFSLWVFVGSQDFARPQYRRYISDPYRGRDFFGRSQDRTRYINQRNRVVDRSIDLARLQQQTRRRFTSQPAQRFLRGRTTSITEGREIWQRARGRDLENFTGAAGRGNLANPGRGRGNFSAANPASGDRPGRNVAVPNQPNAPGNAGRGGFGRGNFGAVDPVDRPGRNLDLPSEQPNAPGNAARGGFGRGPIAAPEADPSRRGNWQGRDFGTPNTDRAAPPRQAATPRPNGQLPDRGALLRENLERERAARDAEATQRRGAQEIQQQRRTQQEQQGRAQRELQQQRRAQQEMEVQQRRTQEEMQQQRRAQEMQQQRRAQQEMQQQQRGAQQEIQQQQRRAQQEMQQQQRRGQQEVQQQQQRRAQQEMQQQQRRAQQEVQQQQQRRAQQDVQQRERRVQTVRQQQNSNGEEQAQPSRQLRQEADERHAERGRRAAGRRQE